jgi:hypothetical protein
MEIFKKSIAVVLFVFLIISCSNNDESKPVKENVILTFGWFADGSCGGDCAQIYRIQDGRVFKDVDYNYPTGDTFEGNFQEIKNINFKDYEALLDLPIEIYNEPNGYLECLECTNDWGGFYIEYQDDDEFHKSWRIRNAIYPDYVKNYRSLLLDKLEGLNSL